MMRWLVRTHFLLWLAALATVPAAILDLENGSWPIWAMIAGVFGFPYYTAQAVIGMQRTGSTPRWTEVVSSAVLASVPFVLAHYLLKRAVLNASRGAPAA